MVGTFVDRHRGIADAVDGVEIGAQNLLLGRRGQLVEGLGRGIRQRAAEKAREHRLEVDVDLLEGLEEHLGGGLVDALD